MMKERPRVIESSLWSLLGKRGEVGRGAKAAALPSSRRATTEDQHASMMYRVRNSANPNNGSPTVNGMRDTMTIEEATRTGNDCLLESSIPKRDGLPDGPNPTTKGSVCSNSRTTMTKFVSARAQIVAKSSSLEAISGSCSILDLRRLGTFWDSGVDCEDIERWLMIRFTCFFSESIFAILSEIRSGCSSASNLLRLNAAYEAVEPYDRKQTQFGATIFFDSNSKHSTASNSRTTGRRGLRLGGFLG